MRRLRPAPWLAISLASSLAILGAPAVLASLPARAASGRARGKARAEASASDDGQDGGHKRRRRGERAAEDEPPPLTSYQIELAIQSRESKIAVDRKRGIALLEEFIDKHSTNRAMPEALYRLAALYWERSQETFLSDMKTWAEKVEACRETPEECPDGPPAEPQLDLQASQKIYVRMIKDYPRFRKIDTVRYLYGFSLRDQGRTDEAQVQFHAIIRDHPTSSFVPDSWLAIGDHRFYVDNDFGSALDAYGHVLDYPRSDPYAMALFKTAWCHWKLGQSELAIRRFKEVLDQGADPDQDEESRKRLADLREEALEYLVQVISEDEKYTAKDIYDFLAAIDGEKYSRKVLVRLAEAYEAQTRYDKSVPTWRFLIDLDANHADNAGFQVHVATGVRGSGDIPKALDELSTLETRFGPRSPWGKAHPKQARTAHAEGEVILFDMAKSVHESAQAAEKDTKVPDKDRYGLAARAYEDYIHRYPSNPHAVEVSYLTGDIYLFKLGKKEQAGDAYLRVGESAPVGPLHRDALLAAIAAYEDAMAEAPPDEEPAPATSQPAAPPPAGPQAGGRTPAPAPADATPPTPEDASAEPAEGEPEAPAPEEYSRVERKFVRAVDLFAALFPEDEQIGAVLFKLGEFFYAQEDYDDAVQRFGKVVVDYPQSANAGAAGDRILESLGRAEDYDNIELWAGKLKTAPAFAAADEQARLDRIIVDSLLKQGDTLVDRGYSARAAGYYLRVPAEYPEHPKAPMALSNAGAALERADRARDATAAYERLVAEYPKSPEAAKATLVVARVYENMADYEAAAVHYDLLVDRYRKHEARAESLYNSGVLYQALGEHDKAIARYQRYAREYRNSDDAAAVSVRVAEVQAGKGDHKAAIATLRKADSRLSGEAEAKAALLLGKSQMAVGKDKDADKSLARAVKLAAAAGGTAKLHGAEARYLQGELVHERFAAAKLDPRPAKLGASLEKKAKLLAEAKNVYLDVLTFAAPEWSTAALLRVGESYEGFAKSLREYPMPKGLSEAEQDAYTEQLDTFALAFEEEAIGAYRSGYQKALELGIYNAHTRKIREALGRLSSQEYPPIAEAGTDLSVAEGRAVGEPVRRLSR